MVNLKQGFRRTISWKKYKSETTTKPRDNNLDYMIDPTLRHINRLFVHSFKNEDDDPARNSFDEYYISLVKFKEFNALIHHKCFDQPIKSKEEAYEKSVVISRKNDSITGKLLDHLYHQNCYKLIGIKLLRQTNTAIYQKISSTGKLEEYYGAKMLFIAEKQLKTILKIYLDSLIVTE